MTTELPRVLFVSPSSSDRERVSTTFAAEGPPVQFETAAGTGTAHNLLADGADWVIAAAELGEAGVDLLAEAASEFGASGILFDGTGSPDRVREARRRGVGYVRNDGKTGAHALVSAVAGDPATDGIPADG